MAMGRERGRRRQRAAGANEASALARLCAGAVEDKKAHGILILDLRKFTYVTDFFVIASGTNPRQLGAMAAAVQEKMKEVGERPIGVEGADRSRWVLLDYGDVVVHLFDPEWRKLYDLELLWGDAPRVEWRPEPAGGGSDPLSESPGRKRRA